MSQNQILPGVNFRVVSQPRGRGPPWKHNGNSVTAARGRGAIRAIRTSIRNLGTVVRVVPRNEKSREMFGTEWRDRSVTVRSDRRARRAKTVCRALYFRGASRDFGGGPSSPEAPRDPTAPTQPAVTPWPRRVYLLSFIILRYVHKKDTTPRRDKERERDNGRPSTCLFRYVRADSRALEHPRERCRSFPRLLRARLANFARNVGRLRLRKARADPAIFPRNDCYRVLSSPLDRRGIRTKPSPRHSNARSDVLRNIRRVNRRRPLRSFLTRLVDPTGGIDRPLYGLINARRQLSVMWFNTPHRQFRREREKKPLGERGLVPLRANWEHSEVNAKWR